MAGEQRETEVKFFIGKLPAPLVSPSKGGGTRNGIWTLTRPRLLEVNLRFDNPRGDLRRAGRVLRLRKDDAARLTYKDDTQTLKGALSRREIEFVVEDLDLARQFIEALGYEVVFIYEKYRTTYENRGAHIMFDELPYGKFIEIEGELDLLRPIADELELDWDKAIPASYYMLFERLCRLREFSFRDLTFENFRGKNISPADMQIMPADVTYR